jgi:hypothetical protein
MRRHGIGGCRCAPATCRSSKQGAPGRRCRDESSGWLDSGRRGGGSVRVVREAFAERAGTAFTCPGRPAAGRPGARRFHVEPGLGTRKAGAGSLGRRGAVRDRPDLCHPQGSARLEGRDRAGPRVPLRAAQVALLHAAQGGGGQGRGEQQEREPDPAKGSRCHGPKVSPPVSHVNRSYQPAGASANPARGVALERAVRAIPPGTGGERRRRAPVGGHLARRPGPWRHGFTRVPPRSPRPGVDTGPGAHAVRGACPRGPVR